MDEGGTSDAYVLVTCGHMKKRTGVQMKTLRPRYSEILENR